jgi:hypothetical protein
LNRGFNHLTNSLSAKKDESTDDRPDESATRFGYFFRIATRHDEQETYPYEHEHEEYRPNLNNRLKNEIYELRKAVDLERVL